MLSAKKLHNKKRKSIQKIFEKLVRQSISETKVDTNDNSVVLIDDTDEKASPSMKRKRSSNKKLNRKNQETVNESCVIINDDDDDDLTTSDSPCANTSGSSVRFPESLKSPFSSSTPNRNAKRTKINVSGLSNIQNNSPESCTDTDNRTKEINLNSFLTIDLTAESNNTKNSNVTDNTVIDLDKHDTSDCVFVSANNSSLSMSGDSDVTVIKAKKRNKKDNMKVFEMRIAKMSANEKGRLLEIITKNIFSGCKSPAVASNTTNSKGGVTRAMETAEDTYIKEIILGPSKSRNSVGSNIYNPSRDLKNRQGLRMIIIDGSNVAMEHGNRKEFSVKGLKICIDYFLKRGHIVKAFVPRFRCKYGKSTDPRLLDELERQRLVVYTPSRELPGKFICSYDDRYIVQCAAEFDGVIVTGDNYRDLMNENDRWRFVIENRLLPFTWVNDMIMFPKDPLGRTGPTLEMFLKHSA